jgi:hypothetical protein
MKKLLIALILASFLIPVSTIAAVPVHWYPNDPGPNNYPQNQNPNKGPIPVHWGSAPRRIDPTCMQDCLNKRYEYGYCKQVCSY